MKLQATLTAASLAVFTLLASPAFAQQQTTVHKSTTTTHTEHHEGPAPVKVAVTHRTVVRHRAVHPVRHRTTVTHKESSATSTTTEQH